MHTSLCDVIYSNQDKIFDEELGEDFQKLKDFIPVIINAVIYKDKKKNAFKAPYKEFLNCISRYKHFGFIEEDEVRIVSHLVPSYARTKDKRPEKKIFYRDGQVPYLDLFSASDIKLPIEKIIVGPHKDKSQRADELIAQLRGTDIKILVSEIPYVDRTA